MSLPKVLLVDTDLTLQGKVRSACGLLAVELAQFTDGLVLIDSLNSSARGCIVADLAHPKMSGVELLSSLERTALEIPVIFTASRIDVRVVVHVMKHGAQTVLEKPVGLDELTTQIRDALRQDEIRQAALQQQRELQERLALLTRKEREVLDLVVNGRTNREVSNTLSISLRAVEDRRARLMRKLGAKSIADLIRFRSSC